MLNKTGQDRTAAPAPDDTGSGRLGLLERLAGWPWWAALVLVLAAIRSPGTATSVILYLAGLACLALGAWAGRLWPLFFQGSFGTGAVLLSGAVLGAAWARLNLGSWTWEAVAALALMASLALFARAYLAKAFGSRRPGGGRRLATVLACLGLLAAPALILPDPSRHMVTLALATALAAGLTALWGSKTRGQLLLTGLTAFLFLFVLEMTGTILLGLDREDTGSEDAQEAFSPAPGEIGWRKAVVERGSRERDAHWTRRCYQGRTININSYGFRGREFRLEKPKNVYRVLVTGGSVSFGTPGGGDELTLQGLLEQRLNSLFKLAGLDIEAQVYNLGLPALTSTTELSILINLLETDPDLVIMFSGWNDLVFAHEPGYNAEGQIGLLVPGCKGAGERNYAGGGVDQTAFGARHTATVPRAVKQLLLLIHERAADSLRGYHWLVRLGRPRVPARTDDPNTSPFDRKVPDLEEQDQGVATQGPGNKAPGEDKGVARFLPNVERARLLTENQGGRFLLAIQPFRYCGPLAQTRNQGARMSTIRGSYLNLLKILGSQKAIHWVDTTRVSDLMESMDSFYDSCHFDGEGYALASEEIWQGLLAAGLIQPLEGVTRTPLRPLAGEGEPSPWALTLGTKAEATYRAQPGRSLSFGLDRIPEGRLVLETALGAPAWVELGEKIRIPYRVDLVKADGTKKVLAQGDYPVGPGRAARWMEIRADLDPDDIAGASLRLTAGKTGNQFETLHWQRPAILTIRGR